MKLLLAAVAVGFGFVLLALATCIPESPEGIWGVYPGAEGRNDTGAPPSVLVLGDSLVYGIADAGGGPQQLANEIRFFGGRNALVAAAGGASLSHFVRAGLIHPAGLKTVEEYVLERAPALAVLALGSNDARILTGTVGDETAYTLDEYRSSLAQAIASARQSARRVILVNVADHWAPTAASSDVARVNAAIADAVAADPAHLSLADWHAFSAAQEAWFAAPGDIHHSAQGRVVYRDFLANAALAALDSGP